MIGQEEEVTGGGLEERADLEDFKEIKEVEDTEGLPIDSSGIMKGLSPGARFSKVLMTFRARKFFFMSASFAIKIHILLFLKLISKIVR